MPVKLPSIWVIEEKQRDGKWLPQFSESMCFATQQDGDDILKCEFDDPKHLRVREYQRVAGH